MAFKTQKCPHCRHALHPSATVQIATDLMECDMVRVTCPECGGEWDVISPRAHRRVVHTMLAGVAAGLVSFFAVGWGVLLSAGVAVVYAFGVAVLMDLSRGLGRTLAVLSILAAVLSVVGALADWWP